MLATLHRKTTLANGQTEHFQMLAKAQVEVKLAFSLLLSSMVVVMIALNARNCGPYGPKI